MREEWRKRMGIALAAVILMTNAVLQHAQIEDMAEPVMKGGVLQEERILLPGGQAVSVALRTQGVLVVAKPASDGAKSALRVGDVILAIQGEDVAGVQDLSDKLNRTDAERVLLSIVRKGRQTTVETAAPVDKADGKRRLGVWVRDSTAGVGTLSYIDPVTGAYGALGHAIVDGDTGDMVVVADGAILNADVVGVTRGVSGKAGELKGSFLKENDQIGTLELNSVYGIYGMMDGSVADQLYPNGLPVGSRADVHTGAASIIATVDENGPKEYGIEIVRCFSQDTPSQKGMTLRVTDERLLALTGGIVQGMSGSPILQDGKIIGAVTHVYLSDAAQGYGMYIEWMLEQSDRIGSAADQTA